MIETTFIQACVSHDLDIIHEHLDTYVDYNDILYILNHFNNNIQPDILYLIINSQYLTWIDAIYYTWDTYLIKFTIYLYSKYYYQEIFEFGCINNLHDIVAMMVRNPFVNISVGFTLTDNDEIHAILHSVNYLY